MVPEALAGRTAMVTGAGSGIGAATARLLAARAAKVAVTDVNLQAAQAVSDDICRSGGIAQAFHLDVRDADQVRATSEAVEAALGLIDILVNNAATGSVSTFLELTPEDWRLQTEVNLIGPFLCAQAVAKRLIEAGRPGAIVNVASAAGLTAVPTYVAYVATKHGLVGLTKSLALELGRHQIRVNAVAPGTVKTPPTMAAILDLAGAEDRVARTHPIGRYGEPGEVAALIAFLASDEAGFITGAAVPVDGGFLAGKGG